MAAWARPRPVDTHGLQGNLEVVYACLVNPQDQRLEVRVGYRKLWSLQETSVEQVSPRSWQFTVWSVAPGSLENGLVVINAWGRCMGLPLQAVCLGCGRGQNSLTHSSSAPFVLYLCHTHPYHTHTQIHTHTHTPYSCISYIHTHNTRTPTYILTHTPHTYHAHTHTLHWCQAAFPCLPAYGFLIFHIRTTFQSPIK